jgi:hypothetical protein
MVSRGTLEAKKRESQKGAVKRSGDRLGKPEKEIDPVRIMPATREAVTKSLQARNLVQRRAGYCP